MGKGKIAVISFLVGAAAMAIPFFVQQQTLQSVRAENGTLQQQAAQVAPLQEQLEKATQDAAATGGSAATQSHDLARLRAEVSELRRRTNELTKAQQQIAALDQRLAASEQEKQAIAARAQELAQARAAAPVDDATSRMNACINNLRLIDAAKQQWALEQRKTAADVPGWEDLRPYVSHGPNGALPTCPDGGTYTIGTVGEKPLCSIPRHVLP
jgi:septal ring factor EnvC (AmiA/AmiB activator)